jgi:hypothetical protein
VVSQVLQLFEMATDVRYEISDVEDALRVLKLDAFLASFIEVTVGGGTVSRAQLSQKLQEAGVSEADQSRVRDYLDRLGNGAQVAVSARLFVFLFKRCFG